MDAARSRAQRRIDLLARLERDADLWVASATADGDARIWICANDGRPVKLEATDTASGGRIKLDFDWSRAPRVEAPE